MGDDRGGEEMLRSKNNQNAWDYQRINLINKSTFINISNLVDTVLSNHKH